MQEENPMGKKSASNFSKNWWLGKQASLYIYIFVYIQIYKILESLQEYIF